MKEIKGITLVALVITIIVLLILAGISIAMLVGENGLLARTQQAIGKSENAQTQENATLADYESEIGGYIDSSRETITISKEQLNSLIDERVKTAIQTYNPGSFSLTKLGETTSTSYVEVDLPNGIDEYSNLYFKVGYKAEPANPNQFFSSYFVTKEEMINKYNNSTFPTIVYFTNGGTSFYGYCYYENGKLYIKVSHSDRMIEVHGVK